MLTALGPVKTHGTKVAANQVVISRPPSPISAFCRAEHEAPWRRSRFGEVRDGLGLKFYAKRDPTALARLNAELFPARGHRKTYDEIPGFPEATTDVRSVDADPQALAEMQDAWTRALELERLGDEALTAAVARLRARQLAELAKVPAIIDLARDLIRSGLSVPIFLNFRDSVRQVAATLGAEVIDGADGGDAHRASAIGDFQADRKHALVLQIGAGGVGVSLHDVCGERPRHSLLSPPESARDLIQALGRNRRVGQRSPALRTILTLAGSVEERVKAAVERNAAQNETINDGDLRCTS